MNELPLLVLVSGAYAAGKTTLARRIGDALNVPVISRDDVYGGLMATAGYPKQEPGGEMSREGVAIFYGMIRQLIDRRVSVVAEQSFRHRFAEPDLMPLMSISRMRVVHAHTSVPECIRRFEERAATDPSRWWRSDEWVIERMRSGAIDWSRFEAPLALESVPVLRVDTTDGYTPSLDRVVEFARA